MDPVEIDETERFLFHELLNYFSSPIHRDDSDSSDTDMEYQLFLSSSSGDEELQELVELHVSRRSRQQKIPKVQNYMGTIKEYSDEEFRRNFRLKRQVANQLIEDFAKSKFAPAPASQGGLPRITAAQHILSFLWFTGNKCCIRDVASRFSMGSSTFHRCTERVLNFFVDLAPKVIAFPRTMDEKRRTARKFKQIRGFRGVLGCIDGTYIPIRTPKKKIRSTYVNRHDGISMTMQGICDANRRFLDVFVGCPSKIHDSRVYKLSFIQPELQGICEGDFHLLGDAAYPISPYLLTPYRDNGLLSRKQRNFNYRLSSTRVRIENTFGLLKQRFRQLYLVDFHTVDKINKFLLSCCVLHNLCIDNGDEDGFDDFEAELMEDDEWLIEHESNQPIQEQRDNAEVTRRQGQSKRDAIADYLYELD